MKKLVGLLNRHFSGELISADELNEAQCEAMASVKDWGEGSNDMVARIRKEIRARRSTIDLIPSAAGWSVEAHGP